MTANTRTTQDATAQHATTQDARPWQDAWEEYPTWRDLPVGAWEALLSREDFHLSAPWLETAERTAATSMRYFTHRAAHGLDAGLATAVGHAEAPWVLGRPDTMLSAAAEAGLEGASELCAVLGGALDTLLPSLVCGGRHMGYSRLLGAGSPAAEQLLERAEEYARASGHASVAFPFVDADDGPLRDLLVRRGYLCHVSGRYSSLTLPPGGLDGYLAALNGKRRRHVRVDRAQLASVGVESELVPLDPDTIPRLAQLETQLLGKYGLAWTPEATEATLRGMAAALGENLLVSQVRGDGEIRGFVVLLRFRDQWYSRQVGFDYAWQGRLPLYFETLFYRPAEEAAEHGVRGIQYGLGSEVAKRSRGCTASTQYAYLLPLTPAAASGPAATRSSAPSSSREAV